MNCIQIILYSKPLNFIKKLIVGYENLFNYAQIHHQSAFKE